MADDKTSPAPPPAVPPRNRPPKQESPMSLLFTDTNENLPLLEFYDKYKDTIPMMAVVALGIYALIERDTFCGGQVMYIHGEASQKRVVARDVKHRTFSIPVDYHIKFKVVKSRNVYGEEQTLREIVEQNTLPLHVKFAVSADTTFHIGPDQQKAKDFSNLILVKEYEDSHLLANCVSSVRIDLNTIPVPLYLTEMTMARVTGVDGYTEEQWKEYMDQVREDMKKVTYDVAKMGNKDIAFYSDDLNLDDDHLYEFITPNNYLSLRPKENRDDGMYASIEEMPPPLPVREVSVTKEICHEKLQTGIHDTSTCESSSKHHYENNIPRGHVAPLTFLKKLGKKDKASVKEDKLKEMSLEDMDISELGKRMKELKLEKHINAFKKAQVDGSIAADLTKDILESEFGFSGLEAIKMMKFIETGHIPK